MTKEMLREKIEEIKDMGKEELEDFSKVVSLSSVAGRAREYLMRAIDIRRDELCSRDSAVVVDGDLDDTDY